MEETGLRDASRMLLTNKVSAEYGRLIGSLRNLKPSKQQYAAVETHW